MAHKMGGGYEHSPVMDGVYDYGNGGNIVGDLMSKGYYESKIGCAQMKAKGAGRSGMDVGPAILGNNSQIAKNVYPMGKMGVTKNSMYMGKGDPMAQPGTEYMSRYSEISGGSHNRGMKY